MVAQPSILFINRVFPPDQGATGRCLAELADAFADAGWRVTILASGRGRERRGAVDIVRTGGSGAGEKPSAFGYLRALIALASRAVLLRRHDLVVTLSDPPLVALLGPLLKTFWRSRLIHWCHDLYPDLLPVLGHELPAQVMRALHVTAGASLRRYDGVVAIGSCMAARLAAHGVPRSRLRTIPNWADRMLEPREPSPPGGFRQEHGLEGRWVVLYSGNFGLAHPFEAVLDAAEMLQKTLPSAVFVLAGAGRRYATVADQVARRRLGNVRMLPTQPAAHAAEMFGAADLHLATMRPEAEGMLAPCKVQSAFAAGRPCLFVGPRGSDPARMIAEYGAGAVVAPEGAAVAGAILRFESDRELWRAGCAGAVRAATDLGFDEAAARFLALATGLLSQRTRREPTSQPAGDADRA